MTKKERTEGKIKEEIKEETKEKNAGKKEKKPSEKEIKKVDIEKTEIKDTDIKEVEIKETGIKDTEIRKSEEKKIDTLKSNIKLFNKYDFEIDVKDEALKDYIYLHPTVIPHTFGRIGLRKKKMRKNIVERLINKLMRGGTGDKISGKVIRTHGGLQGKKTKVIKAIEVAFDQIAKIKKENPIKILIEAISNSAPREDTTRVEYGGVRYQVAVDVSPKRRVDMALRNIALAAILSSFDKKDTLAEALAKELVLAAAGDTNSYAIKRRDEIERIARSAR